MGRTRSFFSNLIILSRMLASCASSKTAIPAFSLRRVLAVESFLAYMTRNVTGNRLSVGTLAIFLETGTNTQLADQIASETGIKVTTGLYLRSLSAPDGPASTYIDMMQSIRIA